MVQGLIKNTWSSPPLVVVKSLLVVLSSPLVVVKFLQKTGKLAIIAQRLYEAKMSLGGNHQRHLMLAKKVGARGDRYK